MPVTTATALGLAALINCAGALGLEQLLGATRIGLVFSYILPALDAVRLRLRRHWLATGALIGLLVVSTAVNVAFTKGNGAVMDALNARSADRFLGTALGLVAIYLLTLPLSSSAPPGSARDTSAIGPTTGWRLSRS